MRNRHLFDFALYSAGRGRLTFDLVGGDKARFDATPYASLQTDIDAFAVAEEAFAFVEHAIARAWPEWSKGYHWGICSLSEETWLTVFENLHGFRFDILCGLHPRLFKGKYGTDPIGKRKRLNRKALLIFLDGFEERIRDLLSRHSQVTIAGI